MAIDSDYVQQMSTQLATYEVQSSLDRLNRNESNYKAQRDALSSLRSSLTTFKSAITKLNSSTSSMLTNKATFSQDGYASATVGTTAQAGSYDFFVKQLASKDQIALQGLTDSSLAGGGTLTIGQGGVDSFDVDMTGITTLDGLASAINDAVDNSGVRATLVRSDGAVNLVLTTEETGAAQSISLSASGNSAVEAAIASPTRLSTAADAEVYLGRDASGIKLTNASNTFENVIEGVSMTFTKAHATGESPLTLDIAQDKEGTQAKAQSFIDAFNTLMGSFDSLTASGSESAARGVLAGDSSIRSIESRLNGLLRTDFGGTSLINFGISADRNGKLTIDAKRFEAAVANDPEGFEALFTGKDNLLESIDKTVASYTSSTNGMLKNRMDTLDMSLRRIDEQFENLQQQYDTHYSRYLKQFTSMMQTMQSMEQTFGLFG
ncbi:flagellar filament capping protein FliD [Pseudomonas sp. MTM4]|uniref:flagellar filament capping protein FliD n=1 Tax=unclassified Pseudomonas TaxID=196821 RepID=UPI0018D2366C|nr:MULTISPECIES: flagellar filament capping protein FliD [unclassified Pseudomonas]MBC8648818.1 flagellar filament capping protein FliD [Pseudomonas sp. MT4]QXY92789.1 flagellar filament capping protein FliD [Pseudomonas sp. MTM4]